MTSCVVLLFSKNIVLFLGGTGELYSYTKEYLDTIILFSIFFMSGYAMEVYIRLDGNPTFPMISVITGGVMNVIMDYILIVVFPYGIKGAAFATGLSQITTSSILLIYILTRSRNLKFVKINNFLKKIGRIIYIGFSEFLAEVSTGISIFLFNMNILHILGDNGVSAFSIISYITTFVTMAMIGFNQGLQPIVSYNLGKKNFENIRKVFKIALATVILFGIIFYGIVNIFTENIVKSFVNDQNTINLTIKSIKIYSIAYIVSGINIVCAGYFTSIKKVKQATFITALRGIILIFIFISILPKFWGETGLWLTVPIAELVTLIISVYFISKLKKEQ